MGGIAVVFVSINMIFGSIMVENWIPDLVPIVATWIGLHMAIEIIYLLITFCCNGSSKSSMVSGSILARVVFFFYFFF